MISMVTGLELCAFIGGQTPENREQQHHHSAARYQLISASKPTEPSGLKRHGGRRLEPESNTILVLQDFLAL